MIRSLRLVAGTVSVAALVAVVGLGAWAVLPAALGWRPTVVMTGSMVPRIQPGDVVVSAPFQPLDLVPGRVVLYADTAVPERLVVHRITGLTDDGALVTQGDANPTADVQPVRQEQVVGLPRLRVPGVGLPSVWLASERWVHLGTLVVALAVVTYGALSTLTVPRDDRSPDDGLGT